MPSIDSSELDRDFDDTSSSFIEQSAFGWRSEQSYQPTLISGLYSESVRPERPNLDVHSPFGRLSGTDPTPSDISIFRDYRSRSGLEVDSIGPLEETPGRVVAYDESPLSENLNTSTTNYVQGQEQHERET